MQYVLHVRRRKLSPFSNQGKQANVSKMNKGQDCPGFNSLRHKDSKFRAESCVQLRRLAELNVIHVGQTITQQITSKCACFSIKEFMFVHGKRQFLLCCCRTCLVNVETAHSSTAHQK